MQKIFYVCFFVHLALYASAQNVPSYVPDQGLVGWWNLDGNAIDSGGLSNHGKVFGVIPAQNRYGETGKATYFKGNNQRIEIPDHASLHSEHLTLSLWVKCENEHLSSFIYKGNRKNGSAEVYSMNSRPESGLKFYSKCKPALGWNSEGFNSSRRRYNLKNWTHLAMTYDGIRLKQYVNGIQVTSTIYQSDIDNCEGSNLHLGYCWDQFPFSFKGSMDELGIWNRALSQQEIQSLFDGKNPKAELHVLKKIPFEGYNRQPDTLVVLYDSVHEVLHFTFNLLKNIRGHSVRICDARDHRIDYLSLKEPPLTLNVWPWKLVHSRVEVLNPETEVQQYLAMEGSDGMEDAELPPYYFLKIFDANGILKEVVRLW